MARSRVRIACLLTTALVWTAAGRAENVRVTDPAMLERMGFSRDANVFIADGAVLNPASPGPSPQFGTSAQSSTTTMGSMFRPRESTGQYGSAGGRGDISYASGDQFWDTQLDLPAGALWDSTSYWGADSHATNIDFILFQSCTPPDGPGLPDAVLLGSTTTAGVSGNYFVTVVPIVTTVIDNASCVYIARVHFNAVGQSLTKARTDWRRQVSPSPASATFAVDVPTTHPFFRYIEALAAAGITGGCGPSQYCPDSAVTRGQMAVFLSLALGLHFPN